jgi:hypothetical protein
MPRSLHSTRWWDDLWGSKVTVVDAATTSVCICAEPATTSVTATAADVPLSDPTFAVIVAKLPVSDVNVTE